MKTLISSKGQIVLPASETIESHDTFVARLRKVHGRKYGFWGQFDRKG